LCHIYRDLLRPRMLSVVLLLLLVQSVAGDVKFPKDQSMKHRWPPLIYKYDGGRIPDGHLRPFGYQKKSEGKAKEFFAMLPADDFYENCVKAEIPCLFQDLMNGTEPMEKWSDKYVEGRWGHLNVSVERFLADKSKEKDRVSIKHFIRNYHHKEMFIRSTVLYEMEPEVPLLPMTACGSIGENLVEQVLWASSGFTPSRLHYDAESQLHCLLDGRKDFVLYHPKHRAVFKTRETYKGSGSGFCSWNPEILSVYENPGLSKTPWKWATLWPGDCLYLPSGYLHQVRAYGRSWSLSTHWIHPDTAQFDDCAELKGQTPALSESSVFWTYIDGDKRIREDVLSGPNLRKHLLLIAASGEISYKRFYNFVLEANENYRDFDDSGHVDDPDQIISPRVIFQRLDNTNSDVITRAQIEEASEELLEELAKMVTPPHKHVKPKDEL
jgi:hypothetical protein